MKYGWRVWKLEGQIVEIDVVLNADLCPICACTCICGLWIWWIMDLVDFVSVEMSI